MDILDWTNNANLNEGMKNDYIMNAVDNPCLNIELDCIGEEDEKEQSPNERPAKAHNNEDMKRMLCQQLCIIDESQRFTLRIIIGIILTFFATSIQREQLICTINECECCDFPNVFPIRLTSSLLILSSLIFFQCLSKQSLEQPIVSCKDLCSKKLNFQASTLVLIASLIRLFDLINVNCGPNNTPNQALLEDIEIADEVI